MSRRLSGAGCRMSARRRCRSVLLLDSRHASSLWSIRREDFGRGDQARKEGGRGSGHCQHARCRAAETAALVPRMGPSVGVTPNLRLLGSDVSRPTQHSTKATARPDVAGKQRPRAQHRSLAACRLSACLGERTRGRPRPLRGCRRQGSPTAILSATGVGGTTPLALQQLQPEPGIAVVPPSCASPQPAASPYPDRAQTRNETGATSHGRWPVLKTAGATVAFTLEPGRCGGARGLSWGLEAGVQPVRKESTDDAGRHGSACSRAAQHGTRRAVLRRTADRSVLRRSPRFRGCCGRRGAGAAAASAAGLRMDSAAQNQAAAPKAAPRGFFLPARTSPALQSPAPQRPLTHPHPARPRPPATDHACSARPCHLSLPRRSVVLRGQLAACSATAAVWSVTPSMGLRGLSPVSPPLQSSFSAPARGRTQGARLLRFSATPCAQHGPGMKIRRGRRGGRGGRSAPASTLGTGLRRAGTRWGKGVD
eukprot:359605-Chlamydomonas_euryale.AAC.5